MEKGLEMGSIFQSTGLVGLTGSRDDFGQCEVAGAVIIHHPDGMTTCMVGILGKRLHGGSKLRVEVQAVWRQLFCIDTVAALQDNKVCRHDAVVAEIHTKRKLFLCESVQPATALILRETDDARHVHEIGHAIGVTATDTAIQLLGHVHTLGIKLTGTMTVTDERGLKLMNLVCVHQTTTPLLGTCLRPELLHPTVIGAVVEGHVFGSVTEIALRTCMSRKGQAT